MKQYRLWTFLVMALLIVSASAGAGASPAGTQSAPSDKPLDLADPFFGVDNDGNTVPGPGVPFGLVWVSPDVVPPPTSGYASDRDIVGFSQTHESGTGGFSKYGNVLLTPLSGPLRVYDLGSGKRDETARPGYYAVTLTRSGVRAELTASRRVGVHRYTFPPGAPAHILVDASSCIALTEEQPPSQLCTGAHLRVLPPDRMEGSASFLGGWNPAPYTIYFAVAFNHPFTASGTWTRDVPQPGRVVASGHRVGGYATFDTNQVEARVAISFVSVAQARANLAEAPSFNTTQARATALWRDALGKISVSGGTDREQRLFYSSLYHAYTMPHDFSGENPWWQSTEPHYEDFYCIWDTFRTVNPLLTLIQPLRERDMVRSLLDTFVHTGWLPDARIAGANGKTQGGSNGDVVVADAVVKGLPGIDLRTAWQALVKDAEVESPDPINEGRVLRDYKRLGYMSVGYRRSASRTMEYAYDDFCVSEVAKASGHADAAARYLRRSRNWRTLWDPTTKAVRPRHVDGTWLEPFDRTRRSGSWTGPYYEGTAWQYSTYVPHDMTTLIRNLGGPQGFVAWLDAFFDTGNYTHDNEPDMLACWLYIHGGRPDKTADRVRDVLAHLYQPTREGLPGNDDAGTTSAWYVWGAMGLYPNAGQPFYYIGSPLFPHVDLNLGGGRHFVIDATDTSDQNRYVQAAWLNGKPLDRSWLWHREVAPGGTLKLQMGPTPTAWTTELPPSPATE